VSDSVIVSLVGLAGSVLLAIVALLSLSTSRQLLQLVSRQLEIAENQAEMKLIRNAFIEMSQFMQIFVDKPHLRPYFYDCAETPTGDERLDNEVASLSEWILTNFATAISQAVMVPEYPIGALKETIQFHLRNSPQMQRHLEERFESFPVTGLTLLRWRSDSKADLLARLDRLLDAAQAKGRTDEAARIRSLKLLVEASPEDADLIYTAHGLAASRAGAISPRDNGAVKSSKAANNKSRPR
jgi:hypothetical protein